MAGVVPLARDVDRRIDLPPPAGAGRRPVSEEAEALAVLSDLVEGGTRFDITDTREYVEGAIVGKIDVRVAIARSWGSRASGEDDDEHDETRETLPPAHMCD